MFGWREEGEEVKASRVKLTKNKLILVNENIQPYFTDFILFLLLENCFILSSNQTVFFFLIKKHKKLFFNFILNNKFLKTKTKKHLPNIISNLFFLICFFF